MKPGFYIVATLLAVIAAVAIFYVGRQSVGPAGVRGDINIADMLRRLFGAPVSAPTPTAPERVRSGPAAPGIPPVTFDYTPNRPSSPVDPAETIGGM